MKNKKHMSLFAQSLIVISAFMIMLFIAEYLLVRRIVISKKNNTDTLKLVKPDELLLYQDNLKNVSKLFQAELKSLEQLNETMAGTVQYYIKHRQSKKIQGYFKKFYAKNFYLDHVFFINRQGRAIGLWPFSEEIHNTIYNYAHYYQYLKNRIIETKKTASYFYMFDQQAVSNHMSWTSVTQPPFFKKENMDGTNFNIPLSHSLLELPTNQSRMRKLPFYMVATPIFYHKPYWGMTGFTVPVSYLFDKFKQIGTDNLLAYFILTKEGYIFYSPNRSDIGKFAGGDSVFMEIKNKLEEYGQTGFLRYKNKIIFFNQTEDLIYIGIPFKFLITNRSNEKFSVPPFLFVFFIFEFFLILLLYFMFYSKVIFVLKNLKINNVEDIEKIKQAKPDTNPLKNRIVSPLFVEAYKQHESDFSVPYFKVQAAAVFISLHNVNEILKDKDKGGVLLNQFIEMIHRLASELDGFVEHLSFDSFVIYFGAPFTDTQYEKKSAEFLNRILSQIRILNQNKDLKLKIGLSAEKGELFVSSFSFEGEEELVIAGDLLFLLQKYEVIAGENVAIIGEAYYKAQLLDKNKITETAEIKIRDRTGKYKVYVYQAE